METIKNITAEAGEECKVDIEILHETLAKLPAKMYFDLYRKMYKKIYGLPPFLGFNGGCCGALGDRQEDNARHYDEQPKISKIYEVEEVEQSTEKIKTGSFSTQTKSNGAHDTAPKEFYEKMLQLKNNFEGDAEAVHINMDDLMCKLLSTLGYGDGVEVFCETGKWYS